MAHIGSLLMNRNAKPAEPKLNHAQRRALRRRGLDGNTSTPFKVPRSRRNY